jgi:hypothetical protein
MPPFWFISTIILFYISSPLLHAIDNRTLYRYFFPLVLMVTLFTYRPVHNANTFLAYIHFIPVYITGMWASYHKERILALGWRLTVPLLIMYAILTVLDLTGNLDLSREITFEYVIDQKLLLFNIYMLKALTLCFLLLMIFYSLRQRTMPLLEVLGQYSFGVFFVHYILISVSRKILEMMGYTFDLSLITYLIFFVFVLMMSIVTVYFVKKVTGRYSRYLIGS